MDLKRPAEALKEYEASAQREPNRYRGLAGAALAAAQAGEQQKAKEYYARLVAMTKGGDPRPETAAGRKWLAAN